MSVKKFLSPLLALALLLVLIIWLASGDFLSSKTTAPSAIQQISSQPITAQKAMRVETQWIEAKLFHPVETLQGQLKPWQQVDILAETSGRVIQLFAQEGQHLTQGAELLQLAKDNRPAQLAQFKAEYASRAADLKAAQRLKNANLVSDNELLRLKSSLLQTEVDLQAIQLELANTRPKAPFAGLLEKRHVELGEFVQTGNPLFTLLNINRLKAVAQISQQKIANIKENQPVKLTLLDGRELTGKVALISSLADMATRTFKLEVVIENPQQLRLAGASATLFIQRPSIAAHYLSLARLSLNQQGRMGIKHVNEQQQVVFSPVELLSSDINGAWLGGLPKKIQLITLGAGFVESGDTVLPVLKQALDSQEQR
ncbi:MAG TPA: efflux RND transporter periplasmic adaptor subunit [Marinospirillum sp.]|uniref:efflux RND transporter periplasmic adaptor subunit n=1 Tax=Marinospirillum sp. TaxID=2183934 RepID=UPI002B45C6FC|nr:efflux RND transporter periplasmic adaptor subunit [Marinospirillum sp.]HKM15832.1 efflux RND transporter periplasmic adaptor subunit [Marinospirillum sp.]